MKLFHCASLLSGVVDAQSSFQSDFGALWVQSGKGTVNGKTVNAGKGVILRKGDIIKLEEAPETGAILFEISKTSAPAISEGQSSYMDQLENPSSPKLLRLDQVRFPPGATAYRHVHAGSGIRVLVDGELAVISDNHTEVAKVGHVWFEPANSPVRAVASQSAPSTSFVRFMVLPESYAGKPSIQILDAEDALKPRLQTTRRHCEEIVQLEDG